MKRNYHRGFFTNASVRLDKRSLTYTKYYKSKSSYCTYCNSHRCFEDGINGSKKSLKKIKGRRDKRVREIINESTEN